MPPRRNAPYSGPGSCDRTIDVHEILKAEIYAQSNDRSTDAVVFGRGVGSASASAMETVAGSVAAPAPTIGFSETYLFLDSITSTSSRAERLNGYLKFPVGELNNNQTIPNVIALQPIEFYFPKQSDPPANTPDFFFYRKVYMRIEELGRSQAVRASGDAYYHFEFDVVNANAIAVKLVPTLTSTATFILSSPISSIDTITCRFLVPGPPGGSAFVPIPIPMDVVDVVSANTNPATFTFDPTLTSSVLGPIGAPAAPGMSAWINLTATLADSVMDAQFKSQYGVLITNIASGVVTIGAANTSAIPAGITGKMLIGKNRCSLQLRITSHTSMDRSHITVSHD
jgi:hypothetical protein